MECEITCDGKKAAIFNCANNGCSMNWTDHGKKIRDEFCKNGCAGFKGCC